MQLKSNRHNNNNNNNIDLKLNKMYCKNDKIIIANARCSVKVSVKCYIVLVYFMFHFMH